MKNFRNIALGLGLIFLGSACTKFVDYDPKENHEITADVYFQTEADYQAAVVGTYDPLQWMYLNVLIGDIASDNSLSGGESATDVVGIQQIDEMTHTAFNENLLSIYKWCYEGINRANYLVENKDKLDFTSKDELYGEVYFLRAYYYFELVKFFGDVVLITDKRLDATDSGTLQRSPVADVYAQIEKDLIAAAAVLPATQSQKGRATSGAANALLGKVYLYQDKFTEASAAFDKVIGNYSLVANFEDQFLKSGENGPESVFEVQYTNTSEWWDWGYTPQGTEGNFGVIHNGPRAYSGPTYATGWSFNIPTKALVDSYDAADSRLQATILDIEAFAAANSDVSYAQGYKHTGYFNNKYCPRAGESGAQLELNYANNYRAIRYADVLLMAAEAKNRGGISDNDARDLLNEVRQRAFGDANHDIAASVAGNDLTKAIWAERNFELAMEGHRFFDLVRTGQAASVIPNFTAGKNELFPIPQQEIEISKLTQNKGY